MYMRNRGISITYFLQYSQNTISINGNNGADGHGNVNGGSYNYNGWRGFWKVVYGASDPGINHVWVTNAPHATHTYSSSSDLDYDRLSNVNGYSVIYAMWATQIYQRSSDSVMRDVIRELASTPGKKCFEQSVFAFDSLTYNYYNTS